MKTRSLLLGILAAVVLVAASCRAPKDNSQVSNFSVGRAIDTNNQVSVVSTQIPASAPSIYLSGQVNNPSQSALIRVTWVQLPNTVIASEDFNGNRNESHPFDFSKKAATSYFASKVDRSGISWPLGEYKADISLNGRKIDSAFFKVVTDSEAEAEANRKIIERVMFGDSLDEDHGQINKSLTRFGRTQDHIYIQVDMAGPQPGVKLEVQVRYPREDKEINTFTATAGNEESLVFDLPLERFGRMWPDRLWATGAYEADIRVNGTSASQVSFTVS